MEPKRTNRSIAFLCSMSLSRFIRDRDIVDFISNRWLKFDRRDVIKILHLMDINSNKMTFCYDLVPIALGKYLLPFRTQKSSPVAPIILLCGKLGRCQIVIKLP